MFGFLPNLDSGASSFALTVLSCAAHASRFLLCRASYDASNCAAKATLENPSAITSRIAVWLRFGVEFLVATL